MNSPKPGTTIRLISEETIRKYSGTVGFKVIECLDGSGDVWFEDDMPYIDGDGNPIQSKCRPDECDWLEEGELITGSV